MTALSCIMNLFDGIKELLVELKNRDVKLGIITSKNRKEFHNDFIPLGIDAYFDTIITVEDSIAPKPFVEPMLAYLDKTGVKPQKIFYIGDTFYDCECATNAGVDFGVAMWECHSIKHFHATYYFETPKDVLNVLSK